MRTSTLAINPKTEAQATEEGRPSYLEALGMIERLHRLLLDVIKGELQSEEREDLSPSQALLLYNIGVREVTQPRWSRAGITSAPKHHTTSRSSPRMAFSRPSAQAATGAGYASGSPRRDATCALL